MKPLHICTGFIFCTFPLSVTAKKNYHIHYKKFIILHMLSTQYWRYWYSASGFLLHSCKEGQINACHGYQLLCNFEHCFFYCKKITVLTGKVAHCMKLFNIIFQLYWEGHISIFATTLNKLTTFLFTNLFAIRWEPIYSCCISLNSVYFFYYRMCNIRMTMKFSDNQLCYKIEWQYISCFGEKLWINLKSWGSWEALHCAALMHKYFAKCSKLFKIYIPWKRV